MLQDLAYGYDLAGNIMAIHDRTPRCGLPSTPDRLDRDFIYDPLYRLIHATGRECDLRPPNPPWDDTPKCSDITKTRFYTEAYTYDPAGNMERFQHSAGSTGNFTRRFTLAPGNNRLASVSIGNRTFAYAYDDNGNLVSEGLTRHFTWNHADQMIGFTEQNGRGRSVEARHLYDAGGMRVKKWVRTNGTGAGESTTYIDGIFEHHRWGSRPDQQNNTLHVMDNQSRIAMARVGNASPGDGAPRTPVKYHLGDHLGSSSVVIGGADARGSTFINREEYYPYGETSFGSFGKKRYRFTGKERDEESGLYYHGARYYAPWLARWASADSLGLWGGINPFSYVSNSPVNKIDPTGQKDQPTSDSPKAVLRPKKPHWEGNNIRVMSDRLKTKEAWTGLGMLPLEDFSHIRFTKEGYLQIDLNYDSPKDPFKWGLLKSIVLIGEKAEIVEKDFAPVEYVTRKPGEKETQKQWEDRSILAIESGQGATVLSRDLHKKIYGELVDLRLPRFRRSDAGVILYVYYSGYNTRSDDTSRVYLVKNLIGEWLSCTLAHELLGHFYLASRGAHYRHADEFNKSDPADYPGNFIGQEYKIPLPGGGIYSGSVRGWIDEYGAPCKPQSLDLYRPESPPLKPPPVRVEPPR